MTFCGSTKEAGNNNLENLIESSFFNVIYFEQDRHIFHTAPIVYYQAEVSGVPVSNPHEGYVMTVYNPDMFESTFPYGIGGSMNHHKWNVVTI